MAAETNNGWIGKKDEIIYRHNGNLPSIVETDSEMQMAHFLSKDGKSPKDDTVAVHHYQT